MSVTASVTVEFFGIARARAGVPSTVAYGNTLGELLLELSHRYPELAASCLDGRQFRPGYAANLGGNRFVTDPSTQLAAGDTVLLLSLDAGG
jgi:molybdopterin converting factor small subunit